MGGTDKRSTLELERQKETNSAKVARIRIVCQMAEENQMKRGAKKHIATLCPKSRRQGLNALDEGDEGAVAELHENDEHHAWCLLEESQSEQWQEVTANRAGIQQGKQHPLHL